MGLVVLYSTGCPQCNVLKSKLDAAGVEYDIVDDLDIMEEKGFTSAPMLEINGEVIGFKQAIDWIKTGANSNV